MNSLLKIVKESGINFSGSLVGMVLNYVLLMVITRFLAPKEYGTFVLAQSIINVSLIFVLFGMPKALDRFIPFYNAAGEEGKTKTLIYGILKITLVLSIVIGLILFIISGTLSHSLFKKPNLALVLKLMVLSMPMLAFIQLVSFAFIGFKELRYRVYIQQLALPLLKMVLAITLFTLGYGLLGWTWAYVLSLAGAAILALWFFRKRISSALSKVSKSPISFGEIVSYSWPLSITVIIMMFLGQIDFLFLGYFRPSSEVGIYRVYFQVVVVLMLVLSSFAQIYKPVISELISKGQLEELKDIYKRVSKWIFIINAFGFLAILLFGMDLVTIFFTKAYLIAPTALFILAAGHFMNSLTGPDGMTLEAFGATKLTMVNSLAMLVVNVFLDYLLIPSYGMIGAAIATASAVTIWHLAGLLEIYVLYGLQPFSLGHLKYATIGGITGGILYILRIQFGGSGILSLLVGVILSASLYIIGLYFSRSLDKTDYEVLRRIKAKLRRKLV